jgi:ACS family tartrate transporter-like MFS transporter
MPADAPVAFPAVDPRAVSRKVAWRILPVIFLLYIIAYLDRANASFAKLQMEKLLQFDDAVFGWGFGVFFVGYLLLEIPGALLVEHWSARKWFARILLTWGLCSMGMALVSRPWHFYTARFLLGLAEAGFFPGVVVYFTHWFPRAERGRAMAGMVVGIPISLALGARVSALLLEVNWFGLAGWQWMFLVEGVPAVVMGAAVLFLLPDRPRHASWLTLAEREWLEHPVSAGPGWQQGKPAFSQAVAAPPGLVAAPAESLTPSTAAVSPPPPLDLGLSAVLRQPTVWLLALGIMAANTGGYALLYWLPTAVRNLLEATGREATPTATLDWMSLIYLCGLAGVVISGQSSDRTGERKWHCVAGMTLTGVFLVATVTPNQRWEWVFVWLCLVGFFCVFWPSPFWVLPTLTLSSSAAAVSIGFINICANVAGLIGSPVVGQLKEHGYSDQFCLWILALCYVGGGTIIALLRVPRSRRPPEAKSLD